MRSKKTFCRGLHKTKVAMATMKPVIKLHVEKRTCPPAKRTKPGNKPKEKKAIGMKAAHVPQRIEGKPLYSTMRVSIFCHELPCQEWDQKLLISSLRSPTSPEHVPVN